MQSCIQLWELMFVNPLGSPIRDPIHPVNLRVRRSSSYHGRPKSLHNPSVRSMANSCESLVYTTCTSSHANMYFSTCTYSHTCQVNAYSNTHPHTHTHTHACTHTAQQHSETVTNLARPGGDTVIVHDDKKPSRGSQTEAFISELMLLLR